MKAQAFKVITFVMAIMLLASVATFAATIDTVAPSAAVIQPTDTLTVTGTATGVSQVTIIVYKGATPDETNIAAIDQQAVVNNAFSFQFVLKDGSTDGLYTIKVGGTDIATPSASEVSVASPTPIPSPTDVPATPTSVPPTPTDVPAGNKISGTVSSVGNAVITVNATINGIPVQNITIDQGTGAYVVPAITTGSVVTLTIAKKSHVTYAKDVTVAADVVKDVTLIPGDTDNSGTVVLDDLMAILNNWEAPIDQTNIGADIDNGGTIVLDDLMAVLNNWEAVYSN